MRERYFWAAIGIIAISWIVNMLYRTIETTEGAYFSRPLY